MKKTRFIITFILFLLIPIGLTTFMYTPAVKILLPQETIYEFSPEGKGLVGDLLNMPLKYRQFQGAIIDKWLPPNLNEHQYLEFDTHNRKNYSDETLLEQSANRAYHEALQANSNRRQAKYQIVFEYNPFFKNKKNVYIKKIFEQEENNNFIYFILLSFVLSILPAIVVYFLYWSNSKSIRDEISKSSFNNDEYVIQTIYKNWGAFVAIGNIWALALLFFSLTIGYIGISMGFLPEPFMLSKNISPIIYIILLDLATSIFLVLYYDCFLILTSNRIIEVKNGKINKQIELADVDKVQEGPASCDLNGKLSITSNKDTSISISMSGDPLTAKKKIDEIIKEYKQ